MSTKPNVEVMAIAWARKNKYPHGPEEEVEKAAEELVAFYRECCPDRPTRQDAGYPPVGYIAADGLTRLPEEIVAELAQAAGLPGNVAWARKEPGVYGFITLRALHLEDGEQEPAALADDATGFARAPDRYTAGGTERETIDEMRDLAWTEAGKWLVDAIYARREERRAAQAEIADRMFAFHCDATALKYERRKGRKGSADEDAAKAKWYRAMASHARGEGPDPRAGRPDFKPYQRPETT